MPGPARNKLRYDYPVHVVDTILRALSATGPHTIYGPKRKSRQGKTQYGSPEQGYPFNYAYKLSGPRTSHSGRKQYSLLVPYAIRALGLTAQGSKRQMNPLMGLLELLYDPYHNDTILKEKPGKQLDLKKEYKL